MPEIRWQNNLTSWKTSIASIALSLLALLVFFYSTFATIVLTWWHSGTYTHGFLIVPIAGYLIWQKRSYLTPNTPIPDKRALVLILVLSLLWLCGNMLNVLVIMQFAVVALVPTVMWLFLGSSLAAKLAFPLGFLFFAVPFGDFLIPSLQDFTAIFVVKALQLSSIPVYLEGRNFYIPSGSFRVEEGCSGVRYLIASICLGTLYTYWFHHSLKQRVLFLLICAAMPIAANVVRAYGIVMLAHLSNYQLAVGVDHILYGWIFFGLVIILTFWIGSLMKRRYPSAAGEEANYGIQNRELEQTSDGSRHESTRLSVAQEYSGASPNNPDGLSGMANRTLAHGLTGASTHQYGEGVAETSVSYSSHISTRRSVKKDLTNYLAITVVAVAIMVGSTLFANWINDENEEAVPTVLRFPRGQDGWLGPYESKNKWQPHYIGVAYQKSVQYKTENNNDIEIYVGYYTHQKQGAELINISNRLFDRDRWKRVSESKMVVKLADGAKWPIREIVIHSESEKRILWYWYGIGGNYTTNEVMAKILELPSKLFRNKEGAAVFAISAAYQFDTDSGRKKLGGFLDTMLLPILESYQRASGGR